MASRDTTSHPFRIFPPSDAKAAVAPLDLVLEGSAFGRGTHPTTVSCLEMLATLAPLTALRVLDLGSGSGILAIAAVRLGAARGVCVDVNPDAVASARSNGAANGVDDRLEHRSGSADDLAGECFDVVIANIGGELLLDQAERIVPLARPGGRLLLSGLLRDWAQELERCYARLGCRPLARSFPGEFCTLLLERG
jgi:ribosomal protein L11 methyltransferase